MVGIASLAPQQGQQAPGQAPMPGMGQPMPGMMPKPGAATPAAEVSQYAGMPLPQLIALFQQRPSGPLLGLITKQAEALELQKKMADQAAMAQAQQQQGTVKDMAIGKALQAMRPTQMAAHGGIMHGYAGGGAVAFQSAGAVPPGLLNPDVDEEGLPRGKDEREQIIDYNNKVRAAYERQMKSKAAAGPRTAAPSMQDIAGVMAGRRQLEQFYKPRDPEAYTPERVGFRVGEGAPLPAATSVPMRMQDTRGGTPEMAALAQMLGSGAVPAPAPSAPTGGQRQTAPTPAATATTATPAELTPEMAAALREQEARLRGRLTRPEALTKAEEGLAALAKSNIEAQQAEAKTYGEEIRSARDAALAKAQRDIFSDPMSLFAIAGGIDTRRGQGAGSLARGLSGLMGEREKQAEAARKEFALAQRDERAMQANIRQTQMLEAQRQVALEKGKLDEVNAINDQLAKLAIDRENFRITRGDKAFEQALQGREVAAKERSARAAEISAGKPTAREFDYALFKANPEKYKEFLAAGAEPKSEGAMLKEIVGAVLKNPLMMQQYPPAIQALVNQELLKLGVTSALPKGAGVRE